MNAKTVKVIKTYIPIVVNVYFSRTETLQN